MKIRFTLKESIYDCKLQITDAQGSRYYLISALKENASSEQHAEIEVYGNTFDLALIPIMPDVKSALNELEQTSWKDKLAKKAMNVLVSVTDKMLLRVGCNYHIQGLREQDRIDITLQSYVFGTFDRFDLLELIPMAYMFFEASTCSTRFAPVAPYGINRKTVIKAAKALALTDILGNGFFALLFSYPIQVGRIKRLSKDKKICKTLSRLHNMSDSERQKFFQKQESFFT